MFIVEWLKDSETVKREAMIGSDLSGALKAARDETGKIQFDAIRVRDAASGETSVYPAHADRT